MHTRLHNTSKPLINNTDTNTSVKNDLKSSLFSEINKDYGYDLNTISLYPPTIIQPKLTINQPNDIYEQEADAMADKVMRMPDKALQVSGFGYGNIQRKCKECEEEEKGLQRKESCNTVSPVSPAVHQTLQSQGQPLSMATRSFMENRFNHDFSKVQIHDNSLAHQSAKDINALAYIYGNSIVFNAGQYNPDSSYGKKLLAHELTHVIQQSKAEQIKNSGISSKPGIGSGLLQRQVPATTPSLLPPLHLPSDVVTFEEGETFNSKNPKIINLAKGYKDMEAANPAAYIQLSTYLSEASKLSSAKEAEEKGKLQQRMIAIQNSLGELGVPARSVQIEAATIYSSKGAGQITANLYKAPKALSPLLLPPGSTLTPTPIPPASQGGGSSLSDMLSFKFKAGPVQFAVELPKSVTIKLPLAIGIAKTLSFELKAETSGDFSFTISLNGSRHLNVSAKAGLKVDKDKGTSGSVGIEITTTKTVCNAPSPESLKASITAAGEKLTKAMKELETANPDDRLSKLIDIGGAIGEMYDAVDKAKSSCKEVPRATINIGLQGPLSPSDSAINDPDPLKRPAIIGGVSLTVPF